MAYNERMEVVVTKTMYITFGIWLLTLLILIVVSLAVTLSKAEGQEHASLEDPNFLASIYDTSQMMEELIHKLEDEDEDDNDQGCFLSSLLIAPEGDR